MILSKDIDANEVYPDIWVGSAPPKGSILSEVGFTHLFLCADEYQVPSSEFKDIEVLHCPFEDEDSIMGAKTMSMVFLAAKAAVALHNSGAVVLITCMAGINRSALVAALTLRLLGKPAISAIEAIRSNRNQKCLSNTCFMRIASGANKATEFYFQDNK